MKGIPRLVVKRESRMTEEKQIRKLTNSVWHRSVKEVRGKALRNNDTDILPDVFHSFEKVFIDLLKVYI